MNSDSVPGIVDRAVLDHVWLNGTDTGKSVKGGLGINDTLVVSMGADIARLFDLRIAEANGVSVGGAIAQATMAAGIAGIALGQGPVAAAGGIAAASLYLQHIFGLANTPGKANAYLSGKELLVAAENDYWLSLAVESCGTTRVSGEELTQAGATYLVRINNAMILVQKNLQMIMPTLEQMQAATVPPGTSAMRLRAMEDPCVQDQLTKRMKRQATAPRATIP